jgi:transposase InsO family protein
MVWKEACVMSERTKFMAMWLEGEDSRSALCREFGISRKTGYKWAARYTADPSRGLADRSHAPVSISHRLSGEVVVLILALRHEHPSWGARKLRVVLSERWPQLSWPAASTIGDLLSREGLVKPRRRRRSALPQSEPFGSVSEANDTWCMDFKGWFRTDDGRRCDPLTVSDAHSRYLLACRIVPPTVADVEPIIDGLLREYGLPAAIRTDNGVPFSSTGAGGLSRLSVDWLKLGIRLERIEPGCPQQNGRHERLHRTLKAETASPPAANLAAQQARFDQFLCVYNEERPHEALGQIPPARVWQPSSRPYPSRIEELAYDARHVVRRVRSTGEIRWRGELVFLTEVLAGEIVGIREVADDSWVVRFATLDIGVIEHKTRKLRRFTAPRPGRREAPNPTKTVTHHPGL